MPDGGGFQTPAPATIGKNPAGGVVIYFSLKAKPTTDVVLEFFDANGKSIRKFTGRAPRPQPSPAAGASPSPSEQPSAPPGEEADLVPGGPPARLTTDLGLNRFVWDMRYVVAVRSPVLIL